jgi:cytochrome oxidase assembly protein ShyY1
MRSTGEVRTVFAVHDLCADPASAHSWLAILRRLRMPRYAALSALMLVVAFSCIFFGTWQITRFEQKRSANDELRRNDRVPTAAIATVLPFAGTGKGEAPKADVVEYRRVTITGSYDLTHETFLRNQGAGGKQGFYVLTPLHTHDGVALIVRGLVPSEDPNATKVTAPPPPTTEVTISGRIGMASTYGDRYGTLPPQQIDSINPANQSARLNTPVYNGFVQLTADQPGAAGLTPLDAPDLSNPAGGALEPQHFAYIVQWYLFAIFALAAPIIMARSDLKSDLKRDDDQIDDPINTTTTPDLRSLQETERSRKLADRYGN